MWEINNNNNNNWPEIAVFNLGATLGDNSLEYGSFLSTTAGDFEEVPG